MLIYEKYQHYCVRRREKAQENGKKKLLGEGEMESREEYAETKERQFQKGKISKEVSNWMGANKYPLDSAFGSSQILRKSSRKFEEKHKALRQKSKNIRDSIIE